MSELLEVRAVSKSFAAETAAVSILDDVNFSIAPGEKVAIVGPSGSGKSTLLSLIGLLDKPTSGSILFNGVDTGELSSDEQARLRNQSIGFIFQSFELIAPFTVSENVAAPLEIGNQPVQAEVVRATLEELGLDRRRFAMPATLSGGEKQRVAIARALIHHPALILADEPTGSLDRETGERVLQMLLTAVSERGSALIIITHDESVAKRMDRVLRLSAKTVHEDV